MFYSDLQFYALMCEYIGTLLIAVSAIMVHKRVRREHKIDEIVETQIKTEEIVAYLGIILITLGIILNIYLIYY